MRPVKRIVKRIALALGVLALAVFALGYIGKGEGESPLPRRLGERIEVRGTCAL